MGIAFTVAAVGIDESALSDPDPTVLARALAQRKAAASWRANRLDESWVLGADTIVYVGDEPLGKPADRNQAQQMLSRISGTDHEVITGLALLPPSAGAVYPPTVIGGLCRTTVTFRTLSSREIDWYLDTGEWEGVAGAYRIQGAAARYIDDLQGSYSNVVGLPIATLYSILRDHNYPFDG